MNEGLPPPGTTASGAIRPPGESEAKAVADVLLTKPTLTTAARRDDVVARSADADLIYLATHAVSDSYDPMNRAFIALGGGNWIARDIMLSRLHAKLAVLSACQTGLGLQHDAGVIGVARAFFLAGVPRTVMSLWSVDDAATAALMSKFMKHTQELVPAEALRQAMIETRKDYPDPAQWASFVVFGSQR